MATAARRFLVTALAAASVLGLISLTLFSGRRHHIESVGNDRDLCDSERFVLAEDIAKNVTVLCYILTAPGNHKTKAIHVKRTWGRRCDRLLFMSSEADEDLPAIRLNVTEGYDHLWQKTMASIRYLFKHHLNDSDWFYKADDDTYAIVENLRYALLDFDAKDEIIIGNLFRPGDNLTDQHVNGGAGYVLSRAAVELIARKGSTCFPGRTTGYEDILLSRCVRQIGGRLTHALDSFNRERFFQSPPEDYVNPNGLKGTPREYFLGRLYDVPEAGLNCCSTTAVSFHWLKPETFYVMEYLLYYLRPYGIMPKFDTTVRKKDLS